LKTQLTTSNTVMGFDFYLGGWIRFYPVFVVR